MTDKIDRLSELKIDRTTEAPVRRRWPWVVAGLVVAVSVVLFLLQRILDAPVEVSVQTVRLSEAAGGGLSVLDASGYVVARRQATVSSKIAGKVSEVLIEEGMRVDKDQVVATLDASSQQVQLALSEAQLASASALLEETRAQLKQSESDLKRAQELSDRKLLSTADLDGALANAETLRARLNSGEQNILVARRGVDVANDQLDNTVIRAPFAGVVVTKNAQPGEMISPISAGGGFTRTGICTIVDMDSLEIEVDVNEAYIQRIQSGQSVNAVLDAYPDWQIPAEVIAIVPTADRQKATVRVRIGFLEKDQRVLRDMGVKVAFLGADDVRSANDDSQAPSASIYISRDALRSDDVGAFVWIVRNDTLQRRAVTTGQTSARGMQILSGLSAGDRIVTAPSDGLSADQTVTAK